MYLGVGGPNLRFCDCAPPRGRKFLGVLSVRSANLLKNVHLQTSDHRREQLNENMQHVHEHAHVHAHVHVHVCYQWSMHAMNQLNAHVPSAALSPSRSARACPSLLDGTPDAHALRLLLQPPLPACASTLASLTASSAPTLHPGVVPAIGRANHIDHAAAVQEPERSRARTHGRWLSSHV